MKKSKFMIAVGATAVALSVCLFIGCRKNNKIDEGMVEDTSYATDQSLSEKMFDDAQVLSDKASVTTGSGSFKTSSCGTVTHAPGTFTIDFGTTNCMCNDGRNRRGKVIITFTGAYADSGSTHTITFDNYYQNDNKVTGTKTVTNMGHNSAGQPYFNITIAGSVTKVDGTVLTTNWTRVRTWTAGYNTPINWTDDVYSITGAGTLVRPSGTVNISIPTTSPLIVSLDCKWIEAGSIIYTLPGGLTRTLNYGETPVCDNQASVVFPNGGKKAITLP